MKKSLIGLLLALFVGGTGIAFGASRWSPGGGSALAPGFFTGDGSAVTFTPGVTALLPTSTNTMDLGSASQSFKDVYASGTLYGVSGDFTNLTWTNATGTNTTSTNLVATNLTATNILSNLTPSANNTYDLGSGVLSWKDIYASGTANLANVIWTSATGTNTTSTNLFATNFQATNVLSNLVATPNNTYDLGSSALSWKDIYASGTARLENVTSTNVTTTNLFVTNVR
ncbi:MAG: hypothetical protein ABII13_05625, partial [Patescibacteria group bacterium]